jgi:arsenate reductase-like glutaredoxin family protein
LKNCPTLVKAWDFFEKHGMHLTMVNVQSKG